MRRQAGFKMSDRQDALTKRLIAEGRYGSMTDIVAAGLRLLEEHEARVAVLLKEADDARVPPKVLRGAASRGATRGDVEGGVVMMTTQVNGLKRSAGARGRLPV